METGYAASQATLIGQTLVQEHDDAEPETASAPRCGSNYLCGQPRQTSYAVNDPTFSARRSGTPRIRSRQLISARRGEGAPDHGSPSGTGRSTGRAAGSRPTSSTSPTDGQATRSKSAAWPCPTPTHSVARPYRPPRRAQLVNEADHQPGAAHAERMAEGNGTAVHVDARGVEPELADHRQALRGERLVQLDQVEVGDGHPRPVEEPAHGRDRPHTHHPRVDSGNRPTTVVRTAPRPARPPARPKRRRAPRRRH